MPTKLTVKDMQHLTEVHTVYEFTHEIEPLMATVHPEPCWIIEPIGCRMASFEAVSQNYQRMFPLLRPGATPKLINTWFADDGFIGEIASQSPMPDGSMVASSQFAWCEFNGNLVSGECNYFDTAHAAHIVKTLGKDFFELPGVTLTPVDVR